jgi:hypothetical protein
VHVKFKAAAQARAILALRILEATREHALQAKAEALDTIEAIDASILADATLVVINALKVNETGANIH